MVQLYSWSVSDLIPGDLRSGKAQAEAATHWLAPMWLTATLCTCKCMAASASLHHPASHRGQLGVMTALVQGVQCKAAPHLHSIHKVTCNGASARVPFPSGICC